MKRENHNLLTRGQRQALGSFEPISYRKRFHTENLRKQLPQKRITSENNYFRKQFHTEKFQAGLESLMGMLLHLSNTNLI